MVVYYDWNYISLTVADPLDASQYTVYVGANNISFIDTGSSPPYPTIAMAVKSVVKVIFSRYPF